MRWLLDSNVLIDALGGVPQGLHVLQLARQHPKIWLGFSAITRIEVLGFPQLTASEEGAVRKLLHEFEEVPVSDSIIEETILIRKSSRIRIPDAIIASTAIITQAVLVTRNTSDFQGISAITVTHPDALVAQTDSP